MKRIKERLNADLLSGCKFQLQNYFTDFDEAPS